MTRNTKIILGVLAGLVLVCLCGVGAAFGLGLFGMKKAVDFASQNVVTDAQDVDAVAAKIAGFDLPEGFSSEFGMSLMGFDMVGYQGSDEHSHIMFIQFPPQVDMDAQQMEEQLKQALQNNGQYNSGDTQMEYVDSFDVTIKGQTVTAAVAEGKSGADGAPFRQATAVFESSSGKALVLYIAPASAWDQATVEAFFGSIR
ncbi:MAG: hypothetical protein ACKOC5_02230 [Chloroflexota bacterium]